jgi:hypothetical protein
VLCCCPGWWTCTRKAWRLCVPTQVCRVLCRRFKHCLHLHSLRLTGRPARLAASVLRRWLLCIVTSALQLIVAPPSSCNRSKGAVDSRRRRQLVPHPPGCRQQQQRHTALQQRRSRDLHSSPLVRVADGSHRQLARCVGGERGLCRRTSSWCCTAAGHSSLSSSSISWQLVSTRICANLPPHTHTHTGPPLLPRQVCSTPGTLGRRVGPCCSWSSRPRCGMAPWAYLALLRPSHAWTCTPPSTFAARLAAATAGLPSGT